MVFYQSINLPIIIEEVTFDTVCLNQFFRKFNLTFKRVVLLCGQSASKRIAEKIVHNALFFEYQLIVVEDGSIEFVNEIAKKVNDLDLIIGIGGGTVLDSAKFLASKLNTNYLAIPTVISNDSVGSPIAILKKNNKKKSYGCKIPMGVLFDINQLRQAPPKTIQNGIGDIISNYTALLDWDLAIGKGQSKPNSFAKMISKISYSKILDYGFDVTKEEDIRDFFYSIVMSGLAMSITGNSRPCSGAEHLIAHAITHEQYLDWSHGFLVGSITPFIAFLHDVKDERIYTFIRDNGFVYDFLNKINPKNYAHLFDLARKIRGERYTILETLTTDDILEQYDLFLTMMRGEKVQVLRANS